MFLNVKSLSLKKWIFLVILIAILIVRVSLFLQKNMFADEVVFINLINKYSFFELIKNMFMNDVNPVFVFVIYKIIHFVGNSSIYLLRLPFFAASLLSAYLFYLILKKLYSDKTALVGLLFFLMSPQSIIFGNMFRNYALTECIFLVLIYLLFFKDNFKRWIVNVLLFILINTHFVGVVWGGVIYLVDFFTEKKLSKWTFVLGGPAAIQLIYIFVSQSYDILDWLDDIPTKDFIFWTLREGITFSGRLVDILALAVVFIFSYSHINKLSKSEKKFLYLLVTHLVVIGVCCLFSRTFVYWNSIWGDKILIYLITFRIFDYYFSKNSVILIPLTVVILLSLFTYRLLNARQEINYYQVLDNWKKQNALSSNSCTFVCHVGASLIELDHKISEADHVYNLCKIKEISPNNLSHCNKKFFLDLDDVIETRVYRNFLAKYGDQNTIRVKAP